MTSCEGGAGLKRLRELEREHDLFAFKVHGWSAWRVLRFPVYQLVDGLPIVRPERPTAVRVAEALGATLKLLMLTTTGQKRDLLLKTCRTALRLQRGGLYRDLYFDDLLERGHKGLKLEEVNSDAFSRQAAAAFRPADLNPVVFTFWGRILGFLFPVDAMDFCIRLSGLLVQETRTSIAPEVLRAMLSTVHWQSRLYGTLLERVRPKVVMLAETGDYGLRIASARQRIPVIELQHGIFDAEHPDAIPLWVEGTAAELVLPDVLASYGEFWIEQLATTHQANRRAVPVGNELIDLARRRSRDRKRNRPRHIVVTSQGLDTQRLVSWLADAVDCAPESVDWRMSIKLHPVNDANSREFDSLQGNHRVSVIGVADDQTVYDLLADADLHLSIGSACHFDAAALDVRTALIPLAGHEPLLRLIDGKLFFLARQPCDIWSILAEDRSETETAYRFSAPGFGLNLQSLVDGFLTERTPMSGLSGGGAGIEESRAGRNA